MAPAPPGSPLFPYTTLFRSGRAEPGFGAGWASDEYRATGIRFDPPGVRLERFAEYVEALKGMWTCDSRPRSEEHTSELQSHHDLVCRLLLEKKKKTE